jgi:hypothetical protein
MSPRNSVGLFNSSGSFAIFAAIRRASSRIGRALEILVNQD